MTYYWLSFVDDDLPKGQRFLGGCLVQAGSTTAALIKAHAMEINPGGEVAIVEITPKYVANTAKFQTNHLYSKAELEAMDEYRTLDDAIKSGDIE
jgi:hypothetical protein